MAYQQHHILEKKGGNEGNAKTNETWNVEWPKSGTASLRTPSPRRTY